MYRILRASKNRFGATAELGIFEMLHDGLREVENPSEVLINQSNEGLSGITTAATIDGIQALSYRSTGSGKHCSLRHTAADFNRL